MLALGLLIVNVTPFVQNTYCHETNRPDVLYLRSFKTDQQLLRRTTPSRIFANALQQQKSLEYCCHFGLSPEYDLVGLVRPPASDIERLGRATRTLKQESAWLLETRDEAEWKVALRELLAVCRAAIIECSESTPGLHWEIQEAARTLGPEKLQLVAEAGDTRAVAAFSDIICDAAGHMSERRDLLRTSAVIRVPDNPLPFGAMVGNRIRHIAPLTAKERRHNVRIYRIRRALFLPYWLGWVLIAYSVGAVLVAGITAAVRGIVG